MKTFWLLLPLLLNCFECSSQVGHPIVIQMDSVIGSPLVVSETFVRFKIINTTTDTSFVECIDQQSFRVNVDRISYDASTYVLFNNVTIKPKEIEGFINRHPYRTNLEKILSLNDSFLQKNSGLAKRMINEQCFLVIPPEDSVIVHSILMASFYDLDELSSITKKQINKMSVQLGLVFLYYTSRNPQIQVAKVLLEPSKTLKESIVRYDKQ